MKQASLVCAVLLTLLAQAAAGDGSAAKMIQLQPLGEWQFNLGIPSWMAGVKGQTGVNGKTVDVDVGFPEILRHLNNTASFNAEARKGSLGFYADFLYLDDRAGVSTKGLVSSLAFRSAEYLAEAEANWRFIERPWGWIEARAGVRYTNLYSRLGLSPDSGAIERASRALADAPAGAVLGLLEYHLRRVLDGKAPVLPLPPLGYEQKQKLLEAIQRAKANPGTVEALQEKIVRILERGLSRAFSLGKDWFDPYAGLAVRYDFCRPFYLAAKADAGGAGVGSRFTWQGCAALGCQVTRRFYAEAGYRYLYVDYRDGGFVYDIETSGAQVTMGILF